MRGKGSNYRKELTRREAGSERVYNTSLCHIVPRNRAIVLLHLIFVIKLYDFPPQSNIHFSAIHFLSGYSNAIESQALVLVCMHTCAQSIAMVAGEVYLHVLDHVLK